MYLGFVGILALAGLGSAKPAQRPASRSIDLNAPSRGFPAEDLPLNLSMPEYVDPFAVIEFRCIVSDIFRVRNNPSVNLTLPLYPGWHPEIEQTIVLSSGIVPDGSQLIANMAAFLYHNWMDTANLIISKTIVAHEPPFTYFRYTVIPNPVPGAVLTPLKVGIVTCWAMRDAVEHPSWPGHIHARIFDADEHSRFALEVGALDIANFGRRSASSAGNGSTVALSPRKPPLARRSIPLPTYAPTGAEPTAGLGEGVSEAATVGKLPRTVEKRWLRCFSRLYWAVLAHYFRDNVGDDPNFPIDYHMHLQCNGHLHRDRIDLYLDPSARPSSPCHLTWDTLALAMLDWIDGIILSTYDYLMPFEIRDGEQLVARLQIITVPDPPMGVVATA